MTTTLKNLSLAEFTKVMAPELDKFLEENPQAVAGKPFDKEKALQDMYAFLHGNFPITWQPSQLSTRQALTVSNACIGGIITVVIDVISIVLQVAGVSGSVSRAAGKEVAAKISEEVLIGLERDIVAIEKATSNFDKATAIFKVFGQIYKVTGIRQILGAIEHNMAWYEWVIMGATISAQIVAWVASDGIAAIAEMVILTAILAQTTADAVSMMSACKITA